MLQWLFSIDGQVCSNSIRRWDDYHLSLVDQEKQTSVFYFHFQQTNGRLPFQLSVLSKQRPFSVSSIFHIHIYIEMELYLYICCHFKQKTEKGNPRDFS